MARAKVEFHPVNEQFARLRFVLIRYFKQGIIGIDSLKGVIGRTRAYEFFNDNIADSEFTPLIQYAILGLRLSVTTDNAVFQWISAKFGSDYLTSGLIRHKYYGKYEYHRFLLRRDGRKRFSRGFITIKLEGEHVRFSHNSINNEQIGSDGDVGFCFEAKNRLYMLGIRENNIRLGIGNMPINLSKDPVEGIVLSTRQTGGIIYSAFFVMFHEGHPNFGRVLKFEDISSVFKRSVTTWPQEAYMAVDWA